MAKLVPENHPALHAIAEEITAEEISNGTVDKIVKDLKKAIHYLENELLHTHEPDGSGGTVPLRILTDDWEGPSEWSESFDR